MSTSGRPPPGSTEKSNDRTASTQKSSTDYSTVSSKTTPACLTRNSRNGRTTTTTTGPTADSAANPLRKTATKDQGPACHRPPSVTHRGVQPGELVVTVLLDTGGASDLAARRGRNRPGWYQYEVRDVQTVRLGYRRGDVVLDDAELVHRVVAGIAAALKLDDGDQLLGVIQRNRYRRDRPPVISFTVASMSSG
jgi:hypothetical protein